MSEERKDGVKAVWRSNGVTFGSPPPKALRDKYHVEYRHTPPEGAPEPGERRVYLGHVRVVRHVYQNYTDTWWVAMVDEGDPSHKTVCHLDDWTRLPLASSKPKYRLPAVELTAERLMWSVLQEELASAKVRMNTDDSAKAFADALRMESMAYENYGRSVAALREAVANAKEADRG